MNILGSCTYYDVNVLRLSQDLYDKLNKEYAYIDADCSKLTMSENDISEFHIPCEAIDYDSFEFDEDELEFLLTELLGKHPYYIVLASGCRWNGSSGYKICENILEVCYRNYDITLILQEKHKDAIKCIESSHDVPTGSPTYIVGISQEEYEKIEDYDFNDIEKFVLSKF